MPEPSTADQSVPIGPRLAALARHPEFRRGARDMMGITLGISAWGLVTGVAMVKSGLGIGLSLLMSLIVFAGSSQLASLPLIASGAPMWVLWATAFCVNLRFVIFSAQWRLYFAPLPRPLRLAIGYFAADLNYVAFLKRFPDLKPDPADQLPYFWGGVALNWVSWQVPAIAGILLADRIPTQWGLGFAGVLALLGLGYSLLHDRNSWVSAAVASCAAVAAYALPLRLNILVAIAAAVAVGLLMEKWLPPRGRAGSVAMSFWEIVLGIVGMAVMTLLTRSFFMIPDREIPLPDWLRDGLRYAPLAALAAVIVPEIVMTQGELVSTWKDARLYATAAATGYFFWKRGILGTILTGTAVMLTLRIGLGW